MALIDPIASVIARSRLHSAKRISDGWNTCIGELPDLVHQISTGANDDIAWVPQFSSYFTHDSPSLAFATKSAGTVVAAVAVVPAGGEPPSDTILNDFDSSDSDYLEQCKCSRDGTSGGVSTDGYVGCGSIAPTENLEGLPTGPPRCYLAAGAAARCSCAINSTTFIGAAHRPCVLSAPLASPPVTKGTVCVARRTEQSG